MSLDEQDQLQEYGQLRYAAGQMADQARADMALLRQVWAYEAAHAALAADPTDADVQAVVSSASDNVKTLAAQRAAARSTSD
jgi:hypothetical protein